MNAALDPLAAQLLLRAYARSTNMLIAGRSFSTDDPTLTALLRAFGAHVRPLSSVEETPASSQVVFALEEDAAPRPGAITVLAPGGVFRAVVAPDGRTITDPGDEGRIEWARTHMPVTEAAARALAPLVAGRSVGLSLVLEPKTAALALMLAEAGARVSVFGWASETREDVAARLRDAGIPVFADSSASREREWQLARDFLAQRSEFLLDDGSHLIRLAHDTQRCPGVLDALVGAAEETTSGLRPLRSFDLRIPVLASNDARSKTLFDNAYGTGQSCWTTILDLIDPRGVGAPVAGMSVVVIGYGDVGRGCARFGAALGARVTVVEVDPVRALQASMDGFAVASMEEATPGAGMLISATGERATIPLSALEAAPAGAIITVAGGVDGEVSIDEAVASSWVMAESGDPHVQTLASPSGKTLRVLERGEGINYTAGEGNPIEIMDMSFGVQLASLRELLTREGELAPGVHDLPREADDAVAAAALHALSLS